MTKKVTKKTREELATAEARRALLDFAVSQSPAIFYVAEISGEQPVRFISDNVETIASRESDESRSDAAASRRMRPPPNPSRVDAAASREKDIDLQTKSNESRNESRCTRC